MNIDKAYMNWHKRRREHQIRQRPSRRRGPYVRYLQNDPDEARVSYENAVESLTTEERTANRIDGYDRDDLGESPDY